MFFVFFLLWSVLFCYMLLYCLGFMIFFWFPVFSHFNVSKLEYPACFVKMHHRKSLLDESIQTTEWDRSPWCCRNRKQVRTKQGQQVRICLNFWNVCCWVSESETVSINIFVFLHTIESDTFSSQQKMVEGRTTMLASC